LHLGRTAIVIASHRASKDARPSGRAMAKQSRGTKGAPATPGSPRRFAPRDDDSINMRPALVKNAIPLNRAM
jgi:hypothetical protein